MTRAQLLENGIEAPMSATSTAPLADERSVASPMDDELGRLSVDQYHAMRQAEILTKNDSVELLEGVLVAKLSNGAPPTPPSLVLGADDFEPLWRLRVDQYHAMIRTGILADDDPVELLEGLLVRTMPKGPSHRRTRRMLLKALGPIMPPGWVVDSQDPITTTDSEPEPDVLVFRTSPDDYEGGHPGPQDIAIVIEIADTTLRRDRRLKKRLYARAAIREYWIVNLIDRQVEVYTDPTGPADEPDFRNRQDYAATDAVPVVVDGHAVGRLTVADVLP
jgi:Uma2 family endonuclease